MSLHFREILEQSFHEIATLEAGSRRVHDASSMLQNIFLMKTILWIANAHHPDGSNRTVHAMLKRSATYSFSSGLYSVNVPQFKFLASVVLEQPAGIGTRIVSDT